jgi:hypothetical protein
VPGLIDGSSAAPNGSAVLSTPCALTGADWKVEFDEQSVHSTVVECRAPGTGCPGDSRLVPSTGVPGSRYIFRVLALIQPDRLFGIFQPLIVKASRIA